MLWGTPCDHAGRDHQFWWTSCSGKTFNWKLDIPMLCQKQLCFKFKTIFFQELDSVNKLISDGKAKANDIRNNLKNLEATSTRWNIQMININNNIYECLLKRCESHFTILLSEWLALIGEKRFFLLIFASLAQFILLLRVFYYSKLSIQSNNCNINPFTIGRY